MEQLPRLRMVRLGVAGLLGVQGVDLAFRILRTALVVLAERHMDSPHAVIQLSHALTVYSLLVMAVGLGFIAVLVLGLTREARVSSLLWLWPCLSAAGYLVNFYLLSQSMRLESTIATAVVPFAGWVLGFLLLIRWRGDDGNTSPT